jgi:hypothetical protein
MLVRYDCIDELIREMHCSSSSSSARLGSMDEVDEVRYYVCGARVIHLAGISTDRYYYTRVCYSTVTTVQYIL